MERGFLDHKTLVFNGNGDLHCPFGFMRILATQKCLFIKGNWVSSDGYSWRLMICGSNATQVLVQIDWILLKEKMVLGERLDASSGCYLIQYPILVLGIMQWWPMRVETTLSILMDKSLHRKAFQQFLIDNPVIQPSCAIRALYWRIYVLSRGKLDDFAYFDKALSRMRSTVYQTVWK